VNAPDPPPQPPVGDPTGRQAYNIVTDTVTGVNVRGWDNYFQLIVGAICLPLGLGGGWLWAWLRGGDPLTGVLLGGFVGLLVALFGSGIFLMIYRAIQHARGRHD